MPRAAPFNRPPSETFTIDDTQDGYFSAMDLLAGAFFSSYAEVKPEAVGLAASLVNRHLRDGHVYLDITEFAGKPLASGESVVHQMCPEKEEWLNALNRAACVGRPGDFKPLILDAHGRLYYQRYWQYEADVARYVAEKRMKGIESKPDLEMLRQKIKEHFLLSATDGLTPSCLASLSALVGKFLIITGSPGTGKTTTAARVLAFLRDVAKENLRVALAAPTGKAAFRLQESVNRLLTRSTDEESRSEIQAMTLHRLLGVIPDSPYFRYHGTRRLPYDLVVVDEASMVDLPMMAKLVDAMDPDATLILLGDKDQLASVEAGYVLGAICECLEANTFPDDLANVIEDVCQAPVLRGPKATGHIIELVENFRFPADQGISILSRAVREGHVRDAIRVLSQPESDDLHWIEVMEGQETVAYLKERILSYYGRFLQRAQSKEEDIDGLMEAFDRFRVLCALRVGPWGSVNVNKFIKVWLHEAYPGTVRGAGVYPGMPIMVIHNDYRLGLFNGDIGLILPAKEDGQTLQAHFSKETNGVRKIPLGRLPDYEDAWAMTVHKSQGSEYDDVLLILADHDSPVITRELLYTGITRARKTLTLLATRQVLIHAVINPTQRNTGLVQAIASI